MPDLPGCRRGLQTTVPTPPARRSRQLRACRRAEPSRQHPPAGRRPGPPCTPTPFPYDHCRRDSRSRRVRRGALVRRQPRSGRPTPRLRGGRSPSTRSDPTASSAANAGRGRDRTTAQNRRRDDRRSKMLAHVTRRETSRSRRERNATPIRARIGPPAPGRRCRPGRASVCGSSVQARVGGTGNQRVRYRTTPRRSVAPLR